MGQPVNLSLQSCIPKAEAAVDERDLRIQLAAADRLLDREDPSYRD